MSPAEFELKFPEREKPQTNALEHVATETAKLWNKRRCVK